MGLPHDAGQLVAVTSAESSTCVHCGEPIIRQAHNGEWAHVVGPGSVLYRCDPAKSGKPYGLDAEPVSADA